MDQLSLHQAVPVCMESVNINEPPLSTSSVPSLEDFPAISASVGTTNFRPEIQIILLTVNGVWETSTTNQNLKDTAQRSSDFTYQVPVSVTDI